MKHLTVKKPSTHLLPALVQLTMAFVFALCCSVLILSLLRLPGGVFQLSLTISLTLLFLAAATWTRHHIKYSLITATVLIIITYLFRKTLFPEETLITIMQSVNIWFRWAFNFLIDRQSGQINQMMILSHIIGAVLSLFAYLTIARFSLPMLSGLCWLLVFSFSWGQEPLFVWGWSMPAVLISILTLAKKRRVDRKMAGQSWQPTAARLIRQGIIPAVITVTLALFLTHILPVSWFYQHWAEDAVTRIFRSISDIRWEEQVADNFSLRAVGYYPLRDRLGGPVELSDQPVMRVSTSGGPLLLKGAIRQTYDGKSWQSDPDPARYRFNSPLWQKEQTDIFDLDRPDLQKSGIEPAAFNETRVYAWSPVGLPTRTVFTAGKPLHITWSDSDPMDISYNRSGELYSDYWIRPDQSVLMSCRTLQTGRWNFPDQIETIQNLLSEEDQVVPDSIKDRYLQLPQLNVYQRGGLLFNLVESLTSNETKPYRKVDRLRDYLMHTATYQLDVDTPPEDAEFVSYFLESGSGYCVYFATAMTVFCRLAGIPARYVEGYVVPPSTGDNQFTEYLITGKQAHAWTEVYLSGIGWIATDATPGGTAVNPDITPLQPSVNPIESTQTSETTMPAGSETKPTGATDSVPPDPNRSTGYGPVIMVLVFIFLALTVWVFTKIQQGKRRHQRDWVQSQIPDPRVQMLYYWSECWKLLQSIGLKRDNRLSASDFLRQETGSGGVLQQLQQKACLAADHLEQTLYAGWTPDEPALRNVSEIFDYLEQSVQKKRGWLFSVRMTLKHKNDTTYYREIVRQSLD